MKRLTLALAVAALAVGGGARADILSTGFHPLGGTTLDANPQLAGLVLEDDTATFSFAAYGGTVSGSVQSRVVRSSVDGTIDFYWRVINDEDSAGAIGNLRIADFVTGAYNANYRTDGSGSVGPDGAFKFDGPYVNFVFGGSAASTLGPGASSYFLLLDTDATSYARTGFYDVTNSSGSAISGPFATFAPAAAVPEPATFALLAGGMLFLTAARRRRS